LPHKLGLSTVDHVFDVDLRGRDRDRAVKRSPAFEFLHELFGVAIGDAFHLELEAH
jgi:hypothetical protein